MPLDHRIPLLATEHDIEATVFPPCFRATRDSAQACGTGVWTKVEFDDEDYDTHDAYDAVTNYQFTVPITGKYHFDANITITMVNAAKIVLAGLFVNAVEASHGVRLNTHGGGDYAATVGDDLSLTAGDTVDARIYHGGGVNRNILNYGVSNHFSGHLISV